MPPISLDYALVDVFAERALEGNMLAIFTDARGLSTERMQALARETNLAETTFVLPEDAETERREGVRVRIFTTEEELPFAGHPTLGTASWLRWNHPELRRAETITLRLKAGPITVRFRADDSAAPGVFGTMQQRDPVFGQVHPQEDVARALGVPPEALDAERPVQTVSTGLPFCVVPFRSVEALSTLACSAVQAQAYLRGTDAKFFYCMAPADADDGGSASRAAKDAGGADFRVRMQFYNGEDPATGSAAGCGIAYLVRHGFVPSGAPVVFEQGIEIRRPSRLHVEAMLEGEKVRGVFVGGRTIPVASGRFFLPFA